MSTKIYNGFRFKTNDLRKVFKEISGFRIMLQPIAEKKAGEAVTRIAVEILDDVCCGMIKKNEYTEKKIFNRNAPVYALNQYMERVKKMKSSGVRDPEVDFDFEMAILPMKNQILGIYYTEQEYFADLWNSSHFVEDYHYQNQTDRPKNISASDWNKRRIDWDKALALFHGVPSMNGFTAICTNVIGLPKKEYMNMIPFPERVRVCVKKQILGAYIKINKIDTAKFGLEDWSRAYTTSMPEWLKTKPGKDEYNRMKKEFSGKLIRKLTSDVMCANLNMFIK